MITDYVLKNRRTIFYYNSFCRNMNNIEAIKKSDISELVLDRKELRNFVEKIKGRIKFKRELCGRKYRSCFCLN